VTRLHPFTLLAIATALPALAWILPAPWGGLGTAAVTLALTLTGGASPNAERGTRNAEPKHGVSFRIPTSAFRVSLLTAAPFWLFLLLLHDVPATIAIGLRLTTMVASVVWLAAVLPPGRLVEAMAAAGWGGWGVTGAYLFAAALSAVSVLRARAQRIVEAQRCRGLSPRGGLGRRLRALRALAVPLVLSVVHEVDERALALETRGFVPGVRRTPLAPRRDRAVERAARWLLLVACAAALGWRIVWHG
jgi:energy-coupling factor transport system permease protein